MASGSVTHSSFTRGGDQGPGCYSSREASGPRQPWGSPSQRDGLSQTLLVILASFCLFLDLGLFFCETDTTVPALLLQSRETYLLLVLDLALAHLGQVCPLWALSLPISMLRGLDFRARLGAFYYFP